MAMTGMVKMRDGRQRRMYCHGKGGEGHVCGCDDEEDLDAALLNTLRNWTSQRKNGFKVRGIGGTQVSNGCSVNRPILRIGARKFMGRVLRGMMRVY